MTLDTDPGWAGEPPGLWREGGQEDRDDEFSEGTCGRRSRPPLVDGWNGTAVATASQLWDDAIVRHLRGRPGVLRALDPPRGLSVVPVSRWCAPADAADTKALLRLLQHLETVPGSAPVLDVGCGPGRHAEMLNERGIAVLGVDMSPTCVALTRAAGAPARLADGLRLLRASLGRWSGILLMDGNVDLAGDIDVLLSAVRDALVPGGRLLVELDGADCAVSDTRALRLAVGDRMSEPFAWSRLSARDLPVRAQRAGLAVCDLWSDDDRVFALLVAPGPADVLNHSV